MSETKVTDPAARVGQVADRFAPRILKRKAVEPPPTPPVAAPTVTPAPDPPAIHCHAAGCQVPVPERGQRCPEHRAQWLAKRYHPPEAADAVFRCIVPDCALRVPHAEFLCARHWGRLTGRRRAKIKHFAELYRVHLGVALEEAIARDRAEAESDDHKE